jgi:hypothetical protein
LPHSRGKSINNFLNVFDLSVHSGMNIKAIHVFPVVKINPLGTCPGITPTKRIGIYGTVAVVIKNAW